MAEKWGTLKERIERLERESPAFNKLTSKIESESSRKKVAWDVFKFFEWTQSEEAKRAFPFLAEIKTPDDLISDFDRREGKEKFWHVDLIESWLRPQIKLSSATRRAAMASVRRFYKANRSELPKSEIVFKKSEIEKERISTQTPIMTSELRTLVLRGNVLERAIVMTCFQAGLGVGEFTEFNEKGFTKDFKNALEREECPIKINLHRPKTDQVYYSFLDRDAVNCLKAWLVERERLVGRPIRLGEPIFLSRDKQRSEGKVSDRSDLYVRIRPHTVERIFRSLAQETGLEPQKKADLGRYSSTAAVRYRIRPHELRDLFKSTCTLSGVNPIASEWFLGHSIDRLGYDKSPFMDVEFFRSEFRKAARMLNLIGSLTSPEETKENIARLVSLEEAVRSLQDENKQLRAELREALETQASESQLKTDEELDALQRQSLKIVNGDFEIATAKTEGELDALLAQGYEPIQGLTMPNGSWKLRKKNGKKP